MKNPGNIEMIVQGTIVMPDQGTIEMSDPGTTGRIVFVTTRTTEVTDGITENVMIENVLENMSVITKITTDPPARVSDHGTRTDTTERQTIAKKAAEKARNERKTEDLGVGKGKALLNGTKKGHDLENAIMMVTRNTDATIPEIVMEVASPHLNVISDVKNQDRKSSDTGMTTSKRPGFLFP